MADESGYESPPAGGVTEPSSQVYGMAQVRAEGRIRRRAELEAQRLAELRESLDQKVLLSYEIAMTEGERRNIIKDAKEMSKFNEGRITYLAKRELGEFRR
tara:strand:+ start:1948 stop:2250 length:303 start_codon:yes stop_codon:yes gene_type:complete